MKQLGKVLNKTSWAQASNTINTNSESVFSAVTMLENAAFKHKGYFLTSEEVEQLYPSAEEGSQAFVYNSSNPSTAPYDIYQMVGGTWADTGVNGGNVNVNLDSKQDTLVGYSESVSGGKATQVAIQGDVIALSGKVSLGSVDDIESVILMSSSQAGSAIAKANTLEQSMSALKSPVKPIHLNSQGKLELNIGKGLYVEDGKLCTTGASGGGGGGTTLSEGDGIRIYNDTINVEYDIDTLRVNSCGGLTVNYGEGLTIKNGKLSAQTSVNAGNGLVKKGDALQVSVGTGLLVADDVYVNMGKGLATDNENKVNVNLDEQTLTTDSSGKVIVNKCSLIGNGLKQESSKLAVNYGAGLALSNKAIVVNYGAGLDIQGGKLVSTVQGGKTYVAGDAIGFDGNNINVRYDGVTISTKDSTDKSLHVMLGSGLKQGTSGIDVAVGSGLAIGEDNKLYSTVSSGKTYTSGDGIDINGNKIAVLYGSGLTTNTCGKLIVDAANLTVGYADYAYYAPTSCSAQYASYAESADHAAVSCSASYASSAGKATADANGNNIADTYLKSVGASGDGISISGGKIAVKYCDGLQITNGSLAIATGDGLHIKDSRLAINPGFGLGFTADGMLNLKLHGKSGLQATSDGLGVNAGVALSTSDGKLNVQYGTGLGNSTDNKLQVLLGTGLAVEGDYIRVEEAVYASIEEANAGVSRAHEVVTKLQTALGGKQNTLTLATGLEWGKTDMIQVKMNAPLNYDNCGRLMLNYDKTLTVSGNKLGVDLYDVMDSGGGLFIKNTGLAVNVGRGLKIDSCQVVVDYGTGMSENNNKIYVDTSKIAGSGIDLDSAYKTLTIGTKAAQELAGTGLAADGPKIKVKYGSGLTTNSCGKLIVDAANLTVGNADKIGGYSAESLWRSDGATWDPHANVTMTPTNYNQEWSFDFRHKGHFTGSYWHVWDEILSTLLRVNADDGKVSAPYGFVGNLTGTADNASALQGYAATDIDRAIALDRSKVIDLTELQGDKWYPCTLQLQLKQLTEIRIWNTLLSESIPSWSTHRNGFSMQVVWEVTAAGWGAQESARKIHMAQYNFADAHPCGGITQNSYDSVEIVWLRGGAKYLYHTNSENEFVVHANGYSWSGSGYAYTASVRTASQSVNPIYGYSGTGSKSSASVMYADNFHGLADKATADSQGNKITTTYAKQFSPTNGLAMNNDRVLYLPNLTASVANGAVDGVKNNNQRVLNLSCGTIQIKLSTGLAIDDNGYLYVQDKYVTK